MYLRARVLVHACMYVHLSLSYLCSGSFTWSSLLNSAYSNLDLAYTSLHAPSTGTRIYLYVCQCFHSDYKHEGKSLVHSSWGEWMVGLCSSCFGYWPLVCLPVPSLCQEACSMQYGECPHYVEQDCRTLLQKEFFDLFEAPFFSLTEESSHWGRWGPLTAHSKNESFQVCEGRGQRASPWTSLLRWAEPSFLEGTHYLASSHLWAAGSHCHP